MRSGRRPLGGTGLRGLDATGTNADLRVSLLDFGPAYFCSRMRQDERPHAILRG